MMDWLGKPSEALLDHDGAFSAGRAIALLGAFLGVWLVLLGSVIQVYEVFFQPGPFHTAQGIPTMALGLGVFTSGCLLKFGQSTAEAKVQVASGNAPEKGSP